MGLTPESIDCAPQRVGLVQSIEGQVADKADHQSLECGGILPDGLKAETQLLLVPQWLTGSGLEQEHGLCRFHNCKSQLLTVNLSVRDPWTQCPDKDTRAQTGPAVEIQQDATSQLPLRWARGGVRR